MAKRDIGQEILAGIREVKDYKAGKKALRVRSLKAPSSSREMVANEYPGKVHRRKMGIV